jgi:myo-inositol-1(or 4)-monophosphatase
MGEESHKVGSPLTSAPTFIVDPIDGTTNFIHGFPNVCISLALCVNFHPSVGIVYNPFTGMLYSAIRGQGAFVRTISYLSPNEADPSLRRLPLRNPGEMKKLGGLKSCLMAIEWGSDRSGINWDSRVKLFSRLGSNAERGGMVHGFRSTGSAAMNMCSVAAGEMDAFFEAGAWAWDVAAGWVILEEAGGKVVDVYPRKDADSWGERSPSIDGRLYFGVRAGMEKEQLGVVSAFWACVGTDVKFDYIS